MPSLEKYRHLKYPMQIEPSEEGGYVVTYPDLPGVIAEGETIEEASSAAEELRMLWTETKLENGWDIPQPGELTSCNGTLTVRIPPSLHKRLSIRAKGERVSLNRLISYLLASGISSSAFLDKLKQEENNL